MNLEQAFGKAIRERRRTLGFSQEFLGFHAELHRTYISQIERGVKSPSLRVIARLAQALQMSASSLIESAENLLGTTEATHE